MLKLFENYILALTRLSPFCKGGNAKGVGVLLLSLLSLTSHANILDTLKSNNSNNKVIPAEQAFKIQAEIKDNKILVSTQTDNSTYLYQDKFKFSTNNSSIKLGTPNFPSNPANSTKKHDEELGDYVALHGNFIITIPYQTTKAAKFALTINYQGCSKYGVCYPPQKKNFNLFIENKEQNSALDLLQNNNIFLISLGFLALGILLSFTPCVLPILPILSRIIIGQKEHSTRKGFILSFSYVQGMSVAYALAGLLIASGGANLTAELQRPWIITLTSIIFFILALSMFGVFNLQLPHGFEDKIDHFRRKQKQGSVAGAFIMGFVSSLIVSPCISAPLAGALIYIANTGNMLIGGVALYLLGIGMGIPLILIGASFGNLLPKAGGWMNSIKNTLGVVLIGISIYLLARILPGQIILVLWGVLLLLCAVQLGLLERAETTILLFKKGIGLIFGLYGLLLIIGATLNGTDIFHPLNNAITNSNLSKTIFHKNYQKINNYAELERVLARAPKNKIIMLDFYADWCVECKILQREILENNDVEEKLKNVQVLKADITKYSNQDKKLMQKLGVFNPPSILFFANKREITGARIISKPSKEEFLEKLNIAEQWIKTN